MSTRKIDDEGFGEKTRILDDKKTGPMETLALRKSWETRVNGALEAAGLDERVSCETLEKQGVNREPTTHEGPVVTQMRRRGATSEIVNKNDDIKQRNHYAGRLNMQTIEIGNEIDALETAKRSVEAAEAAEAAEAEAKEAKRKAEEERDRNTVRGTGGSTKKPALEWLQAKHQGDGSTLYCWPKTGGAVMLDRGNSLQMLGVQSESKVKAIVQAAAEKGWSEIELTGTPDFQEEAARFAARRGIKLAEGTDPAVQEIWNAERRKQFAGKTFGAVPTLGGLFVPTAPAAVHQPSPRPEQFSKHDTRQEFDADEPSREIRFVTPRNPPHAIEHDDNERQQRRGPRMR